MNAMIAGAVFFGAGALIVMVERRTKILDPDRKVWKVVQAACAVVCLAAAIAASIGAMLGQ